MIVGNGHSFPAIKAYPNDKEIEMNIKHIVSTAACAMLFAGAAVAADPSERGPVVGFGSGTGMGVGGGSGSASGVAGGFSSQASNSGSGSQSFGGGSTYQPGMGAGPLSSSTTVSGTQVGTPRP